VIETANVECDSPCGEEIAPGQYVTISVSDTGGIAMEDLTKVFEPFFSTKEPSKGTGLGLSMVYGFVKQSRGHVRIQSEVDSGTTVRIYLPRSTSAELSDEVPSLTEERLGSGTRPRARECETVLVVEDYEDARRFGSSALEHLEYRVLEASDGPSALRLLDAPETPAIHLLFTDVVLPGGMSGGDLAEALRARRPGVPVIYTTGYTRDAIVHNDRLDPDVRLLSKPYSLDAPAISVRQAIDHAARANET
jgi:CheY-like chemotaxis protein